MNESPISILGFPRDPLEVGERISVFWSIFVLDKIVSLASGLPITLQDSVSGMLQDNTRGSDLRYAIP